MEGHCPANTTTGRLCQQDCMPSPHGESEAGRMCQLGAQEVGEPSIPARCHKQSKEPVQKGWSCYL